MSETIAGDRPSGIDQHVGACIRARRKLLGLSQEQLAAHLGITFQQVQKYETGANRISASRLYEIAQVLGAPLGSLFDGLPTVTECAEAARAQALARNFVMTPDGMELAQLFPKIESPRVRRQVLALIRALAQDADEAAEGR